MSHNQAGYKESTFSALSKLPEEDDFRTPAKPRDEVLFSDSIHRPTTATAAHRNSIESHTYPKPFRAPERWIRGRSSDEDDELIRTDEEPPLKKNFLSPHLMKQQRFALVSPPQHYMSFMQPDFTEWKKPTLDEFESSAGKRRFRADFENKC